MRSPSILTHRLSISLLLAATLLTSQFAWGQLAEDVVSFRSQLAAAESSFGVPEACAPDRGVALGHIDRLEKMGRQAELPSSNREESDALVRGLRNQHGITASSIASFGTCASEVQTANRQMMAVAGGLAVVTLIVATVLLRRRRRPSVAHAS